MVEIAVFCGENNRCADRIADILSRYRPTARLGRSGYQSGGADPDFLIFENPPHCRTTHGILAVMPDAGPLPRCGGFFAALLCRPAPPGMVSAKQLVSIGFGARDTLTVSSLSPERAVVSLQRTLVTMSGLSCEPLEFPMDRASDDEVPHLLTAAGILLLCDAADAPEQPF